MVRKAAVRITWLVVGLTSLGLGALGVALPLLPTTPFILLAAFAFAQSSERLHDWLLDHNIFGPLIDNWRKHGAISKRAKIASIVSMVAIVALSVFFGAPTYVVVVQVLVLSMSATFILTRPLPPEAPDHLLESSDD